MCKREWGLSFETKLHVYRGVVLPSLLYGSVMDYSRHLQKHQSFHMRCLRQILHVKWQELIPNTEVIQRSNSLSIGSSIIWRTLSRNRSRGRPRKRFKYTLKVTLKKCHIESWKVHAQDRASWWNFVKWDVSNHEREFIAQAVEKRAIFQHNFGDSWDIHGLRPIILGYFFQQLWWK